MASKYARRGRYRMTPARRAALKKAQAESARRRKRNRRIKIVAGTALGVAGLGTAAYVGYKHGHKASSIAADLRSRTPKSVTGASARVRAAVQPATKRLNSIRFGLTKGFKNGAGPNAGQSKPKPRKWKITKINQISPAEQQALQDKAMGLVREKRKTASGKEITGTRKLSAADRQKYDPVTKEIITPIRGIPSALVRGYKVRANKFSSAIDRHQKERAKLGVNAQTEAERKQAFKLAKQSGQSVRGFYRSENQRKAAKKRAQVRRTKANLKRAAAEQRLRDRAWEQWIKDNPDG